MLYPGVFLLGSNFLDLYFQFLCQMGVVLFHYFSNKFSISCSSSSPSGNPIIWILERLKMPQRFLSLLIFLNSCFFILFWLNLYFYLLFQIFDLSHGFLPFSASSLYILLYFTLYSLHFFLYFARVHSHFYEHPDHHCASDRLAISSSLSSFSGVLLWSFI